MLFLVGPGLAVRASDVVAVVDMDGKVTTPDTADFLRRAERAGLTELAGDNLPKTAVLLASPRNRCRKSRARRRFIRKNGRQCRVVFSPVSAAALNRRSQLHGGGVT